ncbi:hypothetical protein C8J57DRAFT_194320 [Mycena rebaudengoi]|nr:hypothetical protein C8J57DRAFT_194320 [Mycena rebaudengoi]
MASRAHYSSSAGAISPAVPKQSRVLIGRDRKPCGPFRRHVALFAPFSCRFSGSACFEPKDHNTGWYARVADVLLERCEGLMDRENRNLARHVRVFSVSLSWHRVDDVPPLFAQCLESLPNLDTLHILHCKSKYDKNTTAAFEDVELPGVHTIILRQLL